MGSSEKVIIAGFVIKRVAHQIWGEFEDALAFQRANERKGLIIV